MNSVIFEIQDIKINYGLRSAVDGLSFRLDQGESLGLLGLNGAGKTSTIKALLGMLQPRHGSISIFGQKPGASNVFMKLGFAPENALPPDYLTGKEYLKFVGSFRVPNAAQLRPLVSELLEWFELDPNKKIRAYSKGMIRRLVLAQAFIGNPDLLVLDEPLNGLDPLVIIRLRERLDLYRKQGGTILFSSHILSEVEKTCTRILILSAGKLVYAAELANVISEFGSVESAFAAKVGQH